MSFSRKLVIIFSVMCITNGTNDFRFPESAHEFRGTAKTNHTGNQFHHHHHHQGPSKIPLNLIRQLNSIENVIELRKFIDPTSFDEAERDQESIKDRFGETDNKVVTAKSAGCTPEMRTVPLKESTDPSLFYFPACIRVPRCGGCCSADLFSCQPVQQETVDYQVFVSQYVGGNNLVYKGKEVVPVEHHTKCKCDCITKEKDCNERQLYERDECRCECLNMDDQKKCALSNDTKVWDPRTCICSCRNNKECSTGYYYNQSSCSCTSVPETEPIQARQSRATSRKTTQDSVPPHQDAPHS